MILYAVTIFLSAFLLFQVQPLIAKMILPWFGGSAAVWSASMLFFQLLLLAGYAYAHLSNRFLRPRWQMLLHLALLVVSCALLPILPSPAWRPTQAGDPTARILLLLTATIGLPYFLLSSTSPLLQAWFVRRTGSGVPYRLFALSNLGSMLALVSFPFLVEPRLATRQQAFTWSGGYVAFALLCALTAWISRSPFAQEVGVDGEPLAKSLLPERPQILQLVYCLLLATCASILLVSVTNHMSQNIAPIALLWVVPLAFYLLSFIFAFENDRIYQRWLFIPLLIPALGGMAYMTYANGRNLSIKWAIPGFATGLFICCMFCHGELARRRPAPRYLTLFYLMLSLGGALGGVFVALVAPHLFPGYWELPIALVACGVLAMIAAWELKLPPALHSLFGAVFAVAVTTLAAYLVIQERAVSRNLVLQVRNFYGPLQVRDDAATNQYARRTLKNGTIDHGWQLLDPGLLFLTTSYYGKSSGIGRALSVIQASGPIRAGVIGLGAGVLFNYGRLGDYFSVYEINPLIERIAQTRFTFFPHSPADKAILLGDARLVLEHQLNDSGPQNYDILVLDAFSSDAIPMHLLTREAFQMYVRHLKPHGVLAVHISNPYLDLKPVVAQDMAEIGWHGRVVEDDGTAQPYYSRTSWVVLSPDEKFFDSKFFEGDSNSVIQPLSAKPRFQGWTDDFSNIVSIIK
jgi:hypothetical protein